MSRTWSSERESPRPLIEARNPVLEAPHVSVETFSARVLRLTEQDPDVILYRNHDGTKSYSRKDVVELSKSFAKSLIARGHQPFDAGA